MKKGEMSNELVIGLIFGGVVVLMILLKVLVF